LGCARFETVKTVEVLSRTPITPLKRGVNEKGACGRAPVCTADFQSAVSRISNPQGLGIVQSIWVVQGPADWKSAIRQVGNLRHNLAEFPRRLGCARFETVKTVELRSRTPITPLKRGVNEKGACGRAPVCTADFQAKRKAAEAQSRREKIPFSQPQTSSLRLCGFAPLR